MSEKLGQGHPFLPSLPTLLQFALAAEASLVELFRGRYQRCARISSAPIEKIQERTYVRHDWQAVEKALATALAAGNVPTVAAFARLSGVDESTLCKRFPSEVTELYSRAAAQRAQGRKIRREEALLGYSVAAEALVSEGAAVNRRSLEKRSGLPTFGVSGARMDALLETLRRIGSREEFAGGGAGLSQSTSTKLPL